MNLEIITWMDSRQSDGEWRFMEDLPEPKAVYCQSVGWVVGESADALMLAQSIGDWKSEKEQCAGLKQIPKCCIIGREVLKGG